MMISVLHQLEGRTVARAIENDGYYWLSFDDDTGLGIYNDFNIIPEGTNFSQLTGLTVHKVQETKQEISVKFLGGPTLAIDLRDQAFNGPEALLFECPNRPLTVWRNDEGTSET